ncbi:MAG: pantoate kinase [Thermoplasmata archaeon]
MKAFCPGHVTGFFAIEDVATMPEKKGSRGAGFCVELGALADVSVADETEIFFGDKLEEAPVTRRALEMLAPERHFTVRIEHQAPMGQGFGMSAAGTFAACLAAAVELGIQDPKYAALRATHVAEVENRTGLGDAVAQSVGGFVHRLEPGIPPHGELERLRFPQQEVVFCILGQPIKTSEILSSFDARTRIRDSGNICLSDFENLPGFDEFVDISWMFARDTGLATEKMVTVMGKLNGLGKGSMVMLGNTVFAFGNADAIEEKFKGWGTVIRTRVSELGAHIL